MSLNVLIAGLALLSGGQDTSFVVLHRAAGMAAPENTWPALEQALRQGADGVEIDVRRTRDGQFVLYHDDWLYANLGAGTRVEDLTLAEALRLDVGSRWGSRWRGLRMPMLRDVLRFAKEADLKLFLDLKAGLTYEDVAGLVAEESAEPLIWAAGPGLRGDAVAARQRPWLANWSYLQGGEHDADFLADVFRAESPEGRQIMADDARAIMRLLGRSPRSNVPALPQQPKVGPVPFDGLLGGVVHGPLTEAWERRRFAHRAAKERDASQLARLWQWAEGDADPSVRLDAIFAIGRVGSARDVERLLQLGLQPSPPDPMRHPTGMPYFDTYRKANVAGALASLGARDALRKMAAGPDAFDRSAVALGLAANGKASDMSLLIEIVDAADQPEAVLNFALPHVGRLDAGAIPVYLRALRTPGMPRRLGVFGLVGLGDSAVDPLVRVIKAEPDAEVRRAAAWALRWIEGPRALAARRQLSERNDLSAPVLGALRY